MPSVKSTKTSTSKGEAAGDSAKKHKSSKKEKPLNETPEEREQRKKEKKERKERKEQKKLKKEKDAKDSSKATRKSKSSSASAMSTGTSVASVSSSPTSVIPESIIPLDPTKYSMPALKMDSPPPKPERVASPYALDFEAGATDYVESKSEKSSRKSKSSSKSPKSTSKASKSTSKASKSTSKPKASKSSSASKASKASKSSSASKASKSSESEVAPVAYTLTEQRPLYSAYEERQLNQSRAIASFAQAQREHQELPPREQQHSQAHAQQQAQAMSESDMSSFCSSAAPSDRVPNMNIEYGAHNRSRSGNSTNDDHMSVSVVTDPFFGQAKHDMDLNRMTIANTDNNSNRQYQQLQQQYEMQQQYQFQLQQQQQQQGHQGQQGQPKYNGLTDTDYNEAMFGATQAPAPSNNGYGAAVMGPGNYEGNNMFASQHSSAPGTVMLDSATVRTELSRTTQQTVEVSIQQQKFLLRMVKTLSRKLKKADDKIRRLNDKNAAMQELAVQLTKSEEQLEYASEENNEFSVRVRALEQALLMQETELDQALAVIRKHDQEQRKRDLLEAEQETNPFAGQEVDEQLAMREELAAVREELAQLQSERDMAVGKATKLSIQLAELRAESDEFRDQLSECNALIEHLRNTNQSSSNSVGGSKRGFFWGKKDDKSLPEKSGTSSHDDEVVDDEVADTTEENTSVSSDEWNAGTEEMSYHEQRRHEEASMELTL